MDFALSSLWRRKGKNAALMGAQVHLLDGLSEDPVADYSQINTELSLFDPNLARKPQIVALNKIDQPDVQARLGDLERKFKKLNVEFTTISALARTNTRELLIKAWQILQETPALEAFEAPMPLYKPKEDPREFIVTREHSTMWRISGIAIERAAKMTYWEHDGSLRRFQKIMDVLGVNEALRKAGVQDGDTVAIGEFELEWQEFRKPGPGSNIQQSGGAREVGIGGERIQKVFQDDPFLRPDGREIDLSIPLEVSSRR